MKQRRLNDAHAAKRFGVSKAVISRLNSGDLDFFTADMLMQMLERAGKQINVVVSDKKRTHAA